MINAPETASFQNDIIPNGDEARQAVDSLRGYAYQVTAAALAWIDLRDNETIYLEVAEDYAVLGNNVIQAIQVRDTKTSGTITLNSEGVRKAIANFVHLATANPRSELIFHYFTTSSIGKERAAGDRLDGEAGLIYWRSAAAASDVTPIRGLLESEEFPVQVRDFVKARSDDQLRRDMLQRIHWDCGSPSIGNLRQELEDRLIVLGRERFNLNAQEAARLVEILVYRVLQQSIKSNPAERSLNLAALYKTIDQVTRLYVPRSSVEAMHALEPVLAAMIPSLSHGVSLAMSEPSWLLRGESLPTRNGMVVRTHVEDKIQNILRHKGSCILTGANGLGKSSLAHIVAHKLADTFLIVDFRDAQTEDVRNRLDELFRNAVRFDTKALILEDLNHIDNHKVIDALSRLKESLRRRDCISLITCYRDPTARSLQKLNLDTSDIVNCPYFTEAESRELVAINGGDPLIWGRIAHVAGAFGHPQLVLAFVSGMRARGWQVEDIADFVGNGFSSGDVAAEREEARRTLVATLPEKSRIMLYRLSLITGRFDRDLAIAIANVPPEISLAGEYIDNLVGPWIETISPGKYRVSPMASSTGKNILPEQDQSSIHYAIADHYISRRSIDGGDIDLIIMHAIVGGNDKALFILSNMILTAKRRITERLSATLSIFLLIGPERSIYKKNQTVSILLRLAQFKLLAESANNNKVGACAEALFRELNALEIQNKIGVDKSGLSHKHLQALIYGTVLGTMGIANHIGNFIVRIQKFSAIVSTNDQVKEIIDGFEHSNEKIYDIAGVLFAIGTAGLSKVARLEGLINQLDKVATEERFRYLSMIRSENPDFSTLINGPWVNDRPTDFNGAIERFDSYKRMASRTLPWGIKQITVQCWIACAVMLDEYANQRTQALAVLDEAESIFSNDVALTRARAKIYFRSNDHVAALELLKTIAHQIGLDNTVERAFALREAAISAGKVGDWALAQSWFKESKRSAEGCSTPDMAVMAIGLTADAAVAAVQLGQIRVAIRDFADALEALRAIDPTSSLRAAHCHRLVRHSILWAVSYVGKRETIIGGEPIVMAPGICSNPEPNDQIEKHPLGPIDGSWYLLAELEIIAGVNAGIGDDLSKHLSEDRIMVLDIGLRTENLAISIVQSDLDQFRLRLWPFVEGMVCLGSNFAKWKESFDPLNPSRGNIPSIPYKKDDQAVSSLLIDAAFSYAIVSVCNGFSPMLSEINEFYKDTFGNPYVGMERIAASLETDTSRAPRAVEDALAIAFRLLSKGNHCTPFAFGTAAIYFLQYADRSNFKKHLIPSISRWQRDNWTRIVISESFRLSMPSRTIPMIKQALSMPNNNAAFLASLILAMAPAIPLNLSPELKAQFEAAMVGATS